MVSNRDIKILIIGGGMAGLSAAILLHDKSREANVTISLTIFEYRPKPETIGGAINLSPNALRILDRELKLYDTLRKQGCDDVKTAEMFSQHSGKLFGTVPFCNEEYDSLRITRENLLKGMVDTVKERSIPIFYNKKLVALSEDEDGVTATFADGTSETGDILLGCDGTHSATRTLLVDPECKPSYTGISTAYGFYKVSETNKEDDFFFGRTAITSGRKGSILTTYSDYERKTVYFASVMEIAEQSSRDGWRAMGSDIEATKKEILSRFGEEHLGAEQLHIIPEIVRKGENVAFYPVWKLENNPDAKWHSKRCLLLGDAAHAMPPQGQSIGLAFEDAVLLSRLLFHPPSVSTEMISPEAIESIFAKHVSIRRPRIDVEYARASHGWESIKDIGWFKNMMREWMTWIYLSMFSKGFTAMYAYDITKVEI